MIDLQQFCSTEESRLNLQKPWSRDSFTFATNGHIAVRVARRDDVPETKKAPNADLVFGACAEQSVSPLTLKLPRESKQECVDCDGPGTRLHSCPDCSCVCTKCHGTGEVSSDNDVTISIRGTPFALKYARMLARLPGLRFADNPPHNAKDPSKCPPSRFTFDGGEGCLMPVRGPSVQHIETEAA